MNRNYPIAACLVTIAMLSLFMAFLCTRPACGQESRAQETAKNEEEILGLYYGTEALVVTPTRYLKPVSKVAENITVITAREMELMNAHTLADVLKYVPGVQMEMGGGIGNSGAKIHIQGSPFTQVKVLIDGVTLNDLSLNVVNFGLIPIENIERVEIIKGPASSVWGSALAGVVNIITRAADGDRPVQGKLYTSLGETAFADGRASLHGRTGSLGYYLYAGKVRGNSYHRIQPFNQDHFYGKAAWDASDKLRLTLTAGLDREKEDINPIEANVNNRNAFSTLSLDCRLSDDLDLFAALRYDRFRTDVWVHSMHNLGNIERGYGSTARLTWHPGSHTVVFGGDYDTIRLHTIEAGQEELGYRKYALFLNDTIPLGRFAITPGIRYDAMSIGGNFASPSLGITFEPVKRTIVRLSLAKGFSVPPFMLIYASGRSELGGSVTAYLANPDLKTEKVMSYQAGLETSALKYLSLKATLFRNDVWDGIVLKEVAPETFQSVNEEKLLRQGVEVEAKTAPLYRISLLAGYTYTDVRNRDTNERVNMTPRYSIDAGAEYIDGDFLTIALRGHYLTWYTKNTPQYADKNTMVWDVNINKSVYRTKNLKASLFVTGNNLFGASQFLYTDYGMTFRLIEAGVTVEF